MRKLLLLALLPFLSCKHAPENPNVTPPTDHSVTENAKAGTEPHEDSTYITYLVDTTGLAQEPDTPIKLLLEGSFHKREVWKGAEKNKWFGLFYENKKYILKPTSFQVIPTFDPVADATHSEKGKKVISGREIVGETPNTLFFISGLSGIKEGIVDTASFNKVVLPVNKSLSYTLNKKEYTIQAFGDSVKLPSKEYAYQSYGWKVSGNKKGQRIEQTLAEDDFFEDSIYVLLWAGDLDRDGIPDLLLDLSNHYNISRVALFLSSEAEAGKLYKKVAVFETSGS